MRRSTALFFLCSIASVALVLVSGCMVGPNYAKTFRPYSTRI